MVSWYEQSGGTGNKAIKTYLTKNLNEGDKKMDYKSENIQIEQEKSENSGKRFKKYAELLKEKESKEKEVGGM